MMSMPAPIDGVPAGLEYLAMIDTITVHQIGGFETKNKYVLKNANGEQVYYAFEESERVERQCCGPGRGFTMHVLDNFKREVLVVRRPFKCCGEACFGLCANVQCCSSECTVQSPSGAVIGTVMQRSEYCSRIYEIKGVDDNFSLRVKRPCACPCLIDIEFPFHTASGENIGSITRKWGGWARAVYNDADVFSVTFPLELDVRAKAVLLGATFLIDFLDFECPEGLYAIPEAVSKLLCIP
ncbi:hypothetical protein Aduo_002941 [Ancylostoma duodenale]